MFSKQVQHSSFKFTLCGLFNIDAGLLFNVSCLKLLSIENLCKFVSDDRVFNYVYCYNDSVSGNYNSYTLCFK